MVLIRHGLLINIQQVDHRVHRFFFFLYYSIVFTEQTIIKHSADSTAIPQAGTWKNIYNVTRCQV